MNRYKPGLDDERLVGEALAALAQDTDHLEAPPAVETRLRAAFRAPTAAPEGAPAVARRSSAWKWVAAVGTAAGLVWLAYATLRTRPDRPEPRSVEATRPPVREVAPSAVDTAPREVAPVPTRSVRAVADAPRPARRRARPEPSVERFEPLYPGDPLADLDAVHLVRVSVPRSALPSLGWPARPGGRDDRVELDAMVGPDGTTRAVRFISQ